MRESIIKWFSSVRLVQEQSASYPSSHHAESPFMGPDIPDVPHEQPSSVPITKAIPDDRQPVASSMHSGQQPSGPTSNSYWPAHAVQTIPLSFNNYAPATPNLARWTSWSNCPKPGREIRNLLLGSPSNHHGCGHGNNSNATAHHTTRDAATETTTTTSLRSHSRKNSRHSIRYHRAKQPSISKSLQVITTPRAKYAYVVPPKSTDAGVWFRRAATYGSDTEKKSKSQKLLCLWPLPVITHYVIMMSLIVSTLNVLNVLHVTCSAPSFVIHRLEVVNLFLSPFLFDWTLHGVLMFVWNILILGLFEESLTHMLGGTRRFVHVLLGVMVSASTIRQGLGYLFSKSTGWALPSLFFSDSVHECNQGFAPFLFALLTIQSLSIDDKYILIFGDEDSSHKVTVRKVALQLAMCLLNYSVKNILWWSLTGLLTGYLATIIIQMYLAREKQSNHDWRENELPTTPVEGGRRTIPLWRILLAAVKKGAIVVMVTLSVLLICNAYYAREGHVNPAVLNQLTHDRYFFTFVMMTAPRRGDPPLLSQTLDSYLANWPVDPEPGSLYSRMQMLVYTHFTKHVQFDQAREKLSNDLRGQRYIKWVREEGDQMNQRLHVSKALSLAADSFQSSYVALLEDDFPVCGRQAWQEIENVVYEANQYSPNHCGVFVGTGGSGLFIKPDIAKLVARLLLEYKDTPPDIVIQQCLRGDLAECNQCHQTLVTSKTLLMYHIGYNSSTSENRVYKKGEFQCGWRHPFNGDPSVITL